MEAGAWTGKMLGKYEIGPLIGQGGMAQVYKGHHAALKRDVAIKLIHSHLVGGEGFIERFQREAQIVANLRHPNIVQVFDLDAHDGVYYMVMEFIDGPTLSAQIEKMYEHNKLYTMEQTVDLMLALSSALDYAHSLGMIHRDVKPGNVMFTSKGQPVLTDFGLAKIITSPTATTSGTVIGTPMYMSPEQANGETGDARSDIYALGVMLFELATGSAPFQGNTPLSIMYKQVNEPLPPAGLVNNRVPLDVERIIDRATAKKPEDRFQSCAELAVALRELTLHTPVETQKQAPVKARAAVTLPKSAPAPVTTGQRTVSLDALSPILVRVLGPVGRIMEVDRIAGAMRENPRSFPVERLDELLERIAAKYRLTDSEKKSQILKSIHETFGN